MFTQPPCSEAIRVQVRCISTVDCELVARANRNSEQPAAPNKLRPVFTFPNHTREHWRTIGGLHNVIKTRIKGELNFVLGVHTTRHSEPRGFESPLLPLLQHLPCLHQFTSSERVTFTMPATDESPTNQLHVVAPYPHFHFHCPQLCKLLHVAVRVLLLLLSLSAAFIIGTRFSPELTAASLFHVPPFGWLTKLRVAYLATSD